MTALDKEQAVRQLLGNVLDRAERQLSYKGDESTTAAEEGVRPVASDIFLNVRQTIETVDADIIVDDDPEPRLLDQTATPTSAPVQMLGTSPIDNYGQNPTITMTALAHELWKHVIRPGDIVIDATAGNGGDALILSDLLFAVSNTTTSTDNDSATSSTSQLIAIDILEEACLQTHG